MKHSIVTTEEEIIQTAKTAEEVWQEYYTPLIGEAQVSYMVENFQSKSAISKQIEEGYTYYLLKDDDGIVGYVGICPKEEYLFLSKLYIRKEARGKGFASKALALVKDAAKEIGLSKIHLTVNKGNTNSIEIYRNWGFETIDSVVTDIGKGFVMDDYVMELVLNT
ncbi:MAG: GNAT family N-acetyltransferase [Methanocorpusculaceae archaeon]|nr:GNAT family N-acetyltransferase [Methanocorpusculaceae archaeon]